MTEITKKYPSLIELIEDFEGKNTIVLSSEKLNSEDIEVRWEQTMLGIREKGIHIRYFARNAMDGISDKLRKIRIIKDTAVHVRLFSKN